MDELAREQQSFERWGGDRYQIKSLLGKQTGRRTFLAQERATKRLVVIKFVLFGPDFTWQDLKLFEREAQTLQSLQHSALPTYLDFFEVDTQVGKGFALVQTYIEAKSLQKWIEVGRTFSERDLHAIASSLLSILHYLHHRHPPIIHRDIKPSNILLQGSDSNTFKLFLVDFGSVQTAKNNGTTMTVVGTYGYMPPEQFGGRAVPASDLYSLGATLIYLATGQHPADLTQDDMQIDFEQSSALSAAFTRWIRRLTYPDMARRIRTVDAAQESLARLQHRPVTPTPTVSESASCQRAPTHPLFTHQSSTHHEPARLSNYSPSYSPALPLNPVLFDFKVSATPQSLEIRCLSARIHKYSAATESNQKLVQKAKTSRILSAIAFAGFWAALGFAILSDITALLIVMLLAVVTFGFWFPLLSGSAHRHKEAVLRLSSLESGRIALSVSDAPTALLTAEPLDVRSLSIPVSFATSPHLAITLSPPDALSLSQIDISGTQREIQWLRDHIRQWGRAPLS